MKLITEEILDIQYLVEDRKDGTGKDHFITGIFMQAEKQNRNGRVYPVHVLSREADRYNREYVSKNRAFGELGHPENPQINLDRVSHMITKLYADGSNFIGKAKILDTPMGKIAQGLLDGGANLGVSSRALGSLKMNKEGVQVVQDDFMLSTAADIVADPSAPDAFVRGIMESKEWVFVDGKFVERNIDEVRTVIQKTSSRNLEEAKIRAFQHFLGKIR